MLQVVDLVKTNPDDVGAAGFDTSFGWGSDSCLSRCAGRAQSIPNLSASRASPVNNSTLYGSGAARPFSIAWNTSGLNRAHSLFAKTFDTAGNIATSSTITVSVGQPDTTPPNVQVTGVVYDAKAVTMTASAADAQSAVTKVEFYIDGKLRASDTAARWSAKVNAKPLGSGSHTAQAKAYDAAGNVENSGTVTVTTTK